MSELSTIIQKLEELERLHQLNLEMLEQMGVIYDWIIKNDLPIPNRDKLFSLLGKHNALLKELYNGTPKIIQYTALSKRKVTDNYQTDETNGEVTEPKRPQAKWIRKTQRHLVPLIFLEGLKLRLYILDNGHLEGDSNWIVAMSTVGTMENKTPPIKWISIPVYCVIIDSPEGKILYDTGCHPEAMRGYWPQNLKSIFPYFYNSNQLLAKQLELTGTSPEEIKTVILSHLHLDHAGNSHLFRQAEVYVHKRDYDYATQLVASSPNPADHGAYVKADLEIPADKLHFVEDDIRLADGIELISLPGHTPGILGLMVHLEKEGTLIFPSDALYTRENYGPPTKMSGIAYDSVAFRESIEKIRALQKKYDAKIMFSHDMPLFKTMKLAPEYYG